MRVHRLLGACFFLCASSFAAPDVQIAAGNSHNCLLRVGQDLFCWGDSTSGATGFGDARARFTPTLIPRDEGKSVRQIVGGSISTCAIYEDETAKCWGGNATGQLGLGTDTPIVGASFNQGVPLLPKLDLGNRRRVKKIALKGNHSCALLDGGDVKCWGNNNQGQLGLGDTLVRGRTPESMGDSLRPIAFGPNRRAIDVCVGSLHTCVALEDGKVACFGAGAYLGLGSNANRGALPAHFGNGLLFTDLGAGAKAVRLECGTESTCALLEDGRVKCWGRNTNGSLGAGVATAFLGNLSGQMGDTLPAVALADGLRTVDLSCGGGHCCAVLENSTMKCWGLNSNGQLGLGDGNARGATKETLGDNLAFVDLGRLTEVRKVACGLNHTCAVLGSGEVKCWGSGGNSGYNLGTGTPGTVGTQAAHMGANLRPVKLPAM